MRLRILAASAALALSAAVVPAVADPGRNALVERFQRVDRSTEWEQLDTVDLDFDAFHTQGLERVGRFFYLSSVEILELPRPYDDPGRYDRTPGRGRGHLFKFNRRGRLVGHVRLDEGRMYHPGGIDFDGESLWVPVAEYRPDSRAVVYKVDPTTMTASEVFRVRDHVGGVVVDRASGTVGGVSWGSRRLYRWDTDGVQLSVRDNSSHFVDYQDCQYAHGQRMLCGGIAELNGPQGGTFELGGLALVDLISGAVGHEVPVQSWSPGGHVVTRNPVFVRAVGDHALRLYAVPDDDDAAALLVFQAVPESD